MAKYVGPELPPFNLTAKCPKCGCLGVDTRYHRAFSATRENTWDGGAGEVFDMEIWHHWQYGQDLASPKAHPEANEYQDCEHLHRQCLRCSYEWLERCIEESPALGHAKSCRHDDCCHVAPREEWECSKT